MTPESHEVAVIGAGPAGVATALFLAHRRPALASRIVVLEKARFPRDKFCAGAIGQRADDRIEAIGVRVDVPSVRIDGHSVVLGGGTVTSRLGGIGRVVRRMEFDHAFARTLAPRGVRLVEGARVSAIERDASGVRIETSAGSFRAKVVVGADGVGSVVRRSLGLPFGDLRAQVVELDTEPVAGDPPRDLLHLDASNRALMGYAWDFPTLVDGEALVCRGVYALGIGGAPSVDAEALLSQHLAARGLDMARYRVKRFSVRGLEMHRPFGAPRVLLVGEAAGIDPIFGEGIAQGIEYGQLAGEYLAEKSDRDDHRFDDWTGKVARSSLGIDLAARGALVARFYGELRPVMEQVLLTAPDTMQLTMSAFAGRAITPATLARVAGSSGAAAARRAYGALRRALGAG